jgi:ATP/maltotriose-dependent transcriptional regulator MalT
LSFFDSPDGLYYLRPRLTEKLDPEAGRRLTLVSAPAGFGKTTSAPAGGKIVLEVNWDDALC